MQLIKHPGRIPWPDCLRRWFLLALVAVACCISLVVLFIVGLLGYHSLGLPGFDSLSDYHPPQVTRMVDRHGRVVAELFDEKRTVVFFDKIPLQVRQAFLAAEDAEFYQHPGLDFTGMLRALFRNLKAGRVVEGGSTITQQVIKTLLLGPERSYTRKIREVLLALRLESNLTKDEILSLYLNQIAFGHRCHGVQEASRFYFGKDIEELELSEGALLASLPKSPALYSPLRHPEQAIHRRNWVLDQMEENGFITKKQAIDAKAKKLAVEAETVNFFEIAPYYAEHARRILEKHLGREKLYQGGLLVNLALDLEIQAAATAAVKRGLRQVDRRQGYRGSLGRIDPDELRDLAGKESQQNHEGTVWTFSKGTQPEKWKPNWVQPREANWVVVPVVVVEGSGRQAVAKLDLGTTRVGLGLEQVAWARAFSPVKLTSAPNSVAEVLSVGDVVEVEIQISEPGELKVQLSQPPLVQGALVAIDPFNRDVLVMVGGSDFRRSSLIRAVQSKRQPGSAFKPIVYTAAIRSGAYTPTTMMMDSPEVYYASLRGSTWKPGNFERVFVGPVSVRHALSHSINSVAVKVVSGLGPDTIASTARAMGILSNLEPNLSLALGTSEVTPLELTNAYATLAAGGIAGEPVFIKSVIGSDGQEIELPETREMQRVMEAAETYVMTQLLRGVIEEGTGRSALSLSRSVAGKTGTTNQQRDGWFIGYSPELVAGVWVGFDDHSPMGTAWAQGAGTALPIWLSFMEQALEEVPKSGFIAPDGVVFVRVDPENGLVASPCLAGAVFETFIEGTEPKAMTSRLSTCSVLAGQKIDNRIGCSPKGRMPEELYR